MRNPRIRIALLFVTALALTLGVATAIAAQGDSVKIFVMDRCEPECVYVAIGAGTCVLDGGLSTCSCRCIRRTEGTTPGRIAATR